jgi:hypothetical protein
LEANETREREHDKVLHEGCGRIGPQDQDKHCSDRQNANLLLGCRFEGSCFCGTLFLWRKFLGFFL